MLEPFFQDDTKMESCALPQTDLALLHLEQQLHYFRDLPFSSKRKNFQEVCYWA